MSAYLDKAQGVTFVYSNIYQLYQRAKNTKLDAPFVAEKVSSRVLKKEDAKHLSAYAPAELDAGAERTFPVPMGVREAEERAKKLSKHPMIGLKKNLLELNDAQEKLRFLLKEIESMTKKK